MKNRGKSSCAEHASLKGVWGHAPPENFETLRLENAISSVLERQFLSRMFGKLFVIFMIGVKCSLFCVLVT